MATQESKTLTELECKRRAVQAGSEVMRLKDLLAEESEKAEALRRANGPSEAQRDCEAKVAEISSQLAGAQVIWAAWDREIIAAKARDDARYDAYVNSPEIVEAIRKYRERPIPDGMKEARSKMPKPLSGGFY